MSLRGDPRTLRDLGRAIARAGGIATAQRVAKRAAPELTELVRSSFDAQRSPYGDPWPPGRDGQDVDLVESGALRGTLKFEAVGTRVRTTLGVPYAKYHVGERAILPPGGRAVPPPWKARIDSIAREEIAAALPGGG